jgi:hypothetical protein
MQHRNLENTNNSLQVYYNLDRRREGNYNLIVKDSLPKQPTLQVEASGVKSHSKKSQPYRLRPVALKATTRMKERRCTAFEKPMKEFHRFYNNFHLLSYDDSQATFDEHTKNITPKKWNELGRATAQFRYCRGGGGGRGRNASSVKAGKKAMAKLEKQISALTTRVREVELKCGYRWWREAYRQWTGLVQGTYDEQDKFKGPMIFISVYGDVHRKAGSRNSRQQVDGFAKNSMPESAQCRQADAEELLFRARLKSVHMLILSYYVERIV